MEKVIVLGAGGQARVILDILAQNGAYDVVGIIDKSKVGESLDGVPVIGTDEDLVRLHDGGIHCAFVAIGNNHLRRKLSQLLLDIGYELINVISSRSIISSKVKMGVGTAVMPGAIVNVGVCIGDGCIINTNASVDHDCVIGDYVHIAPGTSIAGGTSIGGSTFLGLGSRVIDSLKIGNNVTVGAGAVVIRDIDDNSIIAGVPAKLIKRAKMSGNRNGGGGLKSLEIMYRDSLNKIIWYGVVPDISLCYA